MSRVSKNYAYRLITNEGEKTVCKVRGTTLNYHASKMLNFEVIRVIIVEQGEPIVNVTRIIRSNARGV